MAAASCLSTLLARRVTGLRPGELCHLLVEDVDFGTSIIHVRNRPELGWKTKAHSERRIFLFDELLDVVRRAAVGSSRNIRPKSM